jgi:hypothetical protein
MKVCYVDESGTAQDPVLVMVGVVADAARLHKTSRELAKFFEQIKSVFPEDLKELKGSRILYGKGGWRNVDPEKRKKIFADLSTWLGERKHDVVLSAIDNAKLTAANKTGNNVAAAVTGNAWVAAGLNIALQLQAKHQGEPSNKGNTFLFIDDNSQHFPALCDVLWSPTAWLDGYYPRAKKQEHLDQIIDTAFAVRSHHCALVQIADLLAFVFRRYFELANSLNKPEWPEEATFINQCVVSILPRLYSNAGGMKATNTCPCATWYRSVAPKCYDALLKGKVQA